MVWTLVCGVVAVREALDFDTTKAVLTVVVGWIVWVVISVAIGMVVGVGAAGLGAFTNAIGG